MQNLYGIDTCQQLKQLAFPKNHQALREDYQQEIGEQVVHHRNLFAYIFFGRYLEGLPSTIKYVDLKNDSHVAVDWYKVELMLRHNIDVVIGETKNGYLRALGYVNTDISESDPKNLFMKKPLTKEDIISIIDERLLPDTMIEITTSTMTMGNFVVLRNKYLKMVNDFEIVRYYTDELAEIETSKYSLTIQSKATTVWNFLAQSQTGADIVTRFYQGYPSINIKGFNPEKDIHTIDNTNLASTLAELKRAHQNSLNEMYATLGFHTLGVDKESGVSQVEAKSGNAFSTYNSNIYLAPRNNPLRLLEKAKGYMIYPAFDDQAITTLMIQDMMGGNENANSNSFSGGYDPSRANSSKQEGISHTEQSVNTTE